MGGFQTQQEHAPRLCWDQALPSPHTLSRPGQQSRTRVVRWPVAERDTLVGVFRSAGEEPSGASQASGGELVPAPNL